MIHIITQLIFESNIIIEYIVLVSSQVINDIAEKYFTRDIGRL